MKNKKGISLIVLIVTIIVIIILAAAVILTLNNNNPIDSSRAASLSENRSSINSAIQLYLGKVMAQTQGQYDAKQILIGADGTGAKAVVKTTENIGDYYILDNGKNEILDVTVPTITGATWYVDVSTATVYLIYGSTAKVPTWVTGDTTVKTFVLKKSTDGTTVTTNLE